MMVALLVFTDRYIENNEDQWIKRVNVLDLPFPQIFHELFHRNFVQKDEIPDPNFLSNNHNSFNLHKLPD